MPYTLKLTPIDKQQIAWAVHDESTQVLLKSGITSWESETPLADVQTWVDTNEPDTPWTVPQRRRARAALGGTDYLVAEALKEAKQYAKLHAQYSSTVTSFTPNLTP
jgi:hypothetical protein